jgi:glycosyltransferase involved in cell wall biosynthesis
VSELISVIVSTYNREDALDVALRALSRQSDRDFEVVVADDGSTPATARVVRDWIERSDIPVKHVWHEDRGFRLAEIRNRAISASVGDYLVFLDGDCIARHDFVAAHRRLAAPGRFVAGTRVLLSRELTDRVLRHGLEPELWSGAELARHRAGGGINRLAALLALPLGPLRNLSSRRWRGARGSNMAFWRRDLDKVDGFDAAYSGWGREDSDIFIRLIRAGVLRKDGRFATGVLHLWHAEADRSGLAANERQLDDVLTSARTTARQGVSALHDDAQAAAAGGKVKTAMGGAAGGSR